MQTFRQQSSGLLYICLLVVTIVAVWFSQHSINAYWEQTYHQPSPLLKLSQYEWWQKGGELQFRANQRYANLKNEVEQVQFGGVEDVSLPSVTHSSTSQSASNLTKHSQATNNESQQGAVRFQDVFPTAQAADKVQNVTPVSVQANGIDAKLVHRDEITTFEFPAEAEKTSEKNTAVTTSSNQPAVEQQPKSAYLISTNEKVLFAGDSLMQGVAPWVRKWLIQRNVKSVDLSKQSTGLSYPSFFDWPKTIETTLQNDKSIKLLIMFLGANDPWDFADPHKPAHRLKFKSPEWEAVYVQRMERILHAAEQHQVHVIWLGVPYMKSPKLNEQMRYLEQVYKTQITPRGLFLPTERLLSNGNGKYADSVLYNGKMSKVRSKDGIHFTPSGQKILAELIQQHLIIQE